MEELGEETGDLGEPFAIILSPDTAHSGCNTGKKAFS